MRTAASITLPWICLWLILSLPILRAQTQSPPMAGIAHVAIRVSNLDRSRNFYEKLGYQQAFAAEKDGVPTESFLKINDRQFIELYPSRGDQPLGFLHVCFEGKDLQALYQFYTGQALHPTQVRKAGAGNLLFTMEGPEGQNIEYTQYMPGSRHTLDTGNHLGTARLSTRILAVDLGFTDVPAAADFYERRLIFPRIASASPTFSIPGLSHQQILLGQKPPQNQAKIFYSVESIHKTAKALHRLNIAFERSGKALIVKDPDGNLILYLSNTALR